MKIKQDVLIVLDECTIQGNAVFLPNRQLDRNLYCDVAKVLELLGGKWNRKAKGFIFFDEPQDRLEEVIINREVLDIKTELQFFETPPELAKYLVGLAQIEPGQRVMEPSAGTGRIVSELLEAQASVYAIEINKDFYDKIPENPGLVKHCNDFLQCITADFLPMHRIVMNPPFRRQQDIDHVLHAYKFLEPGGILVAIMSEGTFFRANKKTRDFMTFVHDHSMYTIEAIQPGAFRSSGTMVSTRILTLWKR